MTQTSKYGILATKLALIIGVVLALSSCGSNSNLSEYVSDFDQQRFMQNIRDNHENCNFRFLSPDHDVNYWKSSRRSEVNKYSWMEYTSNPDIDFYQFNIDDPETFKESDIADVKNTSSCITFLKAENLKLSKLTDDRAPELLKLYKSYLENRMNFLTESKLMADLTYTEANRKKYLEIEDRKREIVSDSESIFFQIRNLIDYQLINGVKVFVERCADAFSVFGNETEVNGSLLLTNLTPSQRQINLTVRFKDNEGILVGDTVVYETVPANAKLRASFSAAGSAGAVGGGIVFPQRCTLE